jgi:hypothetical protein
MGEKFAVATCRHCQGLIEFDSNQLEPGEIREIDCPYCARKIKISQSQETLHAEEMALNVLHGLRLKFLNHFHGLNERANFAAAYTWLSIYERYSILTGIGEHLEEQELINLAAMRDILADSMDDQGFKRAHLAADEGILTLKLMWTNRELS